MSGLRFVALGALVGLFCAVAVPGQPRSLIATALLFAIVFLVATA